MGGGCKERVVQFEIQTLGSQVTPEGSVPMCPKASAQGRLEKLRGEDMLSAGRARTSGLVERMAVMQVVAVSPPELNYSGSRQRGLDERQIL